MKPEVKSINTAALEEAAQNGIVGSLRIGKSLRTVFHVQSASGNYSQFIDGETGLNIQFQTSKSGLGLVAQNACHNRYQAAGFNYRVVDVASKWVETATLTLPLSNPECTEYIGILRAARLDAFKELNNTRDTAASLVGLPDDTTVDGIQRLYNVEGSVVSGLKDDLDRLVKGEYCDLYFSSKTGDYRMVKHPACNEFVAPLYGQQPSLMKDSEMLEALEGAPEYEIDNILSPHHMNARR